MDNYGFIILRHVNSEITNRYWNQNVKLIRSFYPEKKIIIIDDNSNKNFLKGDYNYKNVTTIQSEYPKRGELLPFIYFLKYGWFKNAIIIHDSVFIHRRINFSKFNMPVLPLWHFVGFDDNPTVTPYILKTLKNNSKLLDMLIKKNTNVLGLKNEKWNGVFGCQCYINFDFLTNIENKYNITKLISYINCRRDRCCLERIFGLIFTNEYPLLNLTNSLFGTIQDKYWGYKYSQYIKDFQNKKVKKPWVKVWTGR